MIYFAPEAEAELTAAGLEPGRMGYFASRAAPMGPVPAEVVTATFHNFSGTAVARVIPKAWDLAAPEKIIAARFRAVDGALRRMLGGEVLRSPQVAEAAGLARRAATACSVPGRPLAAGHLELDWPEEPHLELWHALSVLREHRGDGHVAALVDAGLSGPEALVTHTATGNGFLPEFARTRRGWTEAEWDATVAELRGRGLLDDAGGLTERGRELRTGLEDATDRLAAGPWSALGEAGTERLGELGGPLVRALLDAGCFPRHGVFAGS
ncbi:MAG TPA: hypothetical protein VGH99_08175 [Pseudonocardia sp.]|jgi:hypothetical protein